MTNDVPLHPGSAFSELLRALAKIGQLAEAVLAEQGEVAAASLDTGATAQRRAPAGKLQPVLLEERETRASPHTDQLDSVEGDQGTRSHRAEPEGELLPREVGGQMREADVPGQREEPRTSRPLIWRDSAPAAPRQFFTKHAAERLQVAYGVSYTNMVQTMAALAHQIHGTHLAGLEALNLGKLPLSDGAPGTIWAVEIFHQVGFVVTDANHIIVSALARDSKQLLALPRARRAALEAFASELRLRFADPVYLAKHYRRRPVAG